MLLDFLIGRGQVGFLELVFGIASIVIAITLHEFSHAIVAVKLGDPTPKIQGRVTLNPLVHLDKFGSIMLLLFGFGWGRPVSVNTTQLKYGRKGLGLVSLAGPVSNFLMATIGGLLLRFGIIPLGTLAAPFMFIFVNLNLALGVFNLLPFGPLDGFKIAMGFLPTNLALKFQALRTGNSMLIFMLVVILFFDPIYRVVHNFFFRIVMGI